MKKGIQTISIDGDPAAVEINYLRSKNKKTKRILPLIMDLTNPSSGIGWHHSERLSLQERGPADTALALALIHHLAISNNLPFDKIADFFNSICNHLIIEYVPKDDSQAQRLLLSREDIFENYTQAMFEKAFEARFEIIDVAQVVDSSRILYHMRRR